MSSEEALRLVVMPDEHGTYRFDEMGMEHLAEYLGYLFGYMSGPVLPETPEEQQARIAPDKALPVIVLQEA